jgi:hypothetical protein
MSDDFFRRMFRIDRDSFQWLLTLVKPIIDGKTSRSIAPPNIKLAVALRFLAGAIYLDIAFAFNISEKHVMKYAWEVLEAIDQKLTNIEFPLEDEEKL